MQERFYKKVKRLLRGKGITMQKLGDCLGVDKSAISHRFSGKTDISVDELIIIANLLNMTLDQLCRDDPSYAVTASENEFLDAFREISPERQEVIISMMKSLIKE